VDSRTIEELTLNAWPPLEILLFDGWILSFSEGYTRRANSVHPLYPSTLELAEKIATCEAAYAAHGHETVFKITSAPGDMDLDRALERRAYASIALTSVQSADLSALPSADADTGIVLSSTLDEKWFADFNRLAVTPKALHGSERRLLEKIAPPHAFGSIASEGEVIGVGLVVVERGFAGLFDIIVDTRVRNQGLGRRLCISLLRWARDHSAHTGYLAVMADNAPAHKLYANLGFSELYTYWYRAAPTAR
jgi:N-acetylglutamate synthase